MTESSSNTLLGIFQLIGLWLIVVMITLVVLDWLFPRMRRGDDEASHLDAQPWYPTAPRQTRRIGRTTEPVQISPAYWRSNLRVIGILLIIWFAASFGPAIASPLLNQISILTGFPLGYYMGAQGSLIVFLGIIAAYAWRAGRLDEKFRLPGQPPLSALDDRARLWRLGFIFFAFALGFMAFLWLLVTLETSLGLPASATGWILLLLTIGLYAIIGIKSRSSSLDDYFVAGRRIPAFFNGLAIAGDWMSAASFLSLAGVLWLLGYEGLAYIMGWTGGFVLVALLLAPYLRKFGQFTIPDFVAARYGSNTARIVSAIIGIIISFTYLTAQVTGVGLIMSRFLGVNYLLGVTIGLGAVLFCSYLGGMRAITWTQVAQAIILVIAFLVPVTLLAYRDTGVAVPQIMFGEALAQIEKLEAAQGITAAYVTPFNDWTPWNFMALMVCLMLGTAGMPHILTRFYTVPTVHSARRSVSWAMLFICLLYFTVPAYAAFSRWEVLQNVVGKPIDALPAWTINWSNAGLLTITDNNHDGVLQFDEFHADPDFVVLATPEIAGLPEAVAALVAAGGLAAALSTADGLLMVIAAALAHDVYARAINPAATLRSRLTVGRLTVLLAAAAAAFTATRRLGIIAQLVAGAFSLAAATFFPILVLGIFWKRTNGRGAVAGMIGGLSVTLGYAALNALHPEFAILGISNVAAGIFGIPVNFLATIIVSRLTAPPSPEAQALVDSLRQP